MKSSKTTKKLFSIGLVTSGLLAGVLLMLILGPRAVEMPAEIRTVELHRSVPAVLSQAEDPTGAMLLNAQFKRVAHQVRQAVVSVHAASSWYDLPCTILSRRSQEYGERERLGNGVVISPQGYIITNLHVVEDACALRVTFLDKEEFDAEITGVDPSTDLAVIRIDVEGDYALQPLSLGDSNTLAVGEWVLAVGDPMSLKSTVTAGIISALGRRVDVLQDEFNVEDFIQTDAAISPGNSGGALVNLHGELIGINTVIASHSGYNHGYGFAIPVNLVDRVARDLIAYGTVKRGYVGIQLEAVTAEFAEELGMEQVRGVYLSNVIAGGPAYQAGMRIGDVVLEVDALPVNEPNQLQGIIAQRRPGDRASIAVWRRGEIFRREITLMGSDDPGIAKWVDEAGRSRLPSESRIADERWGLVLRPVRGEDRRSFGVEDGVVLLEAEPDSPAARAGVPEYVILQKISGEPVRTVRQALSLLSEKDVVVLTVQDVDGHRHDIRLSERE